MATSAASIPDLLEALLRARSPSGAESEAQAVLDSQVRPKVDAYAADALGNRRAIVNPEGSPTLLLAGHMDELGFLVKYIDDKGYLFLDRVGGIDLSTVSGRVVEVLTADGPVLGVTGRRAIHLLSEDERKKVPQLHQLWIDIGATSKAEALERVSIGDPAVYRVEPQAFAQTRITGRAMDNKTGCYAVVEMARRLAAERDGLQAQVIATATTQEEVGVRGARSLAASVRADFAIAVDVGHATDHPECDNKRFGEFTLGGGPIVTRGVNTHPLVFERLVACAKAEGIPYQVEADARPTSTDGRELQMGPGGVACGVVSIPLRYMHTASEVTDLRDIEHTVQLLAAFARSLTPEDTARVTALTGG